jgi:uncharacterized delta-60 repeat protein
MKNKTFFLAMLLITVLSFNAKAQSGANDPTFNPTDVGFGFGDGANNSVSTTAIQSDGKIIIGGNFSSYNGTSRSDIARLNADGTLDATFNTDPGANGTIYTTVLQSDGKIIIGGNFTYYNWITRNYIARLNADGTLDKTFNPGTGASSNVYTTVLQSDGKIIIGGDFTSCNGTSINRIARLNADGTLDATFNPGTGANDRVYTTVLQSDGKIIIGGYFTSYNGTSRGGIARLNADGTLDATFNPGTGASEGEYSTYVSAAVMQSDGKIIIGGYFASYNGTAKNSIARLNADGTLDATFNPGTGVNYDDDINTIVLQSDGKIIIGGGFVSYNGTSRNYIARLNADGTLDASFNPGTGASRTVNTTNIQSDGKIIIGGDFTTYNGTTRNSIARLNADGTLDATLNSGTGASGVVNTTTVVNTTILQSDSKIIIGGNFTTYNGITRNNIARLNVDGMLDATFNPGTGTDNVVNTTALQSDGKIIIGGNFTTYNGTAKNRIARLNSDGTLDATFKPGTGANDVVYTTVMQSDGKIIIGGNFTSYNGTSINRIARLNADGTLDATFNSGTGVNYDVLTTALQSDGKIIIGGDFTTYNGTARNRIARLNADGTLDATFNPGTGASYSVYTIAVQSDGKIIIGGSFESYNKTERDGIARLNADGTLDAIFNPGTGVNSTVVTVLQSNGKIIISGNFTSYNGTNRKNIARINADGTLDAAFNPGTGAGSAITTTVLQSDGKIIIGGYFTSYNGVGRNRVARILNSTTDEISSLQSKTISVYPNPVSNELHIEIEGNNEQIKVEVLNSMGQVVFNGNIVEKTTVQTSNFAPGFYLIKIGNDKTFELKKIIKE